MELIDYVRMLRRRWAWVVLLTLLGLAAGVAWAVAAPKSYSATAELFVAGVVADEDVPSSVAAESASSYVLDRMPSYAALIGSPEVTTSVNSQLQSSFSTSSLAGVVSAKVPARTVLIRVTAVDADPQTAARLADAAATGLGSTIERLESTTLGGGRSPVSVTLSRPAPVPVAPASPDRTLSVGLGLVLGLGAGLVAASLVDQAARRPEQGAGSGARRRNGADEVPAVPAEPQVR